jgi:hypothetical protein
MVARAKVVYRDNETGRLITEQEAGNRDRSTWTEELITMTSPKFEIEKFQRHVPTVDHEIDEA